MIKEKIKKRQGLIKILSCVLIISALASIFIISSSAEESTASSDYTLNGWWFFDGTPSAPPSSLNGTITGLSFYSPLYDYEITGVTFIINGDNWALCYGSDDMIYSYNPSQSIVGWASGNSRAVYFDNITVSNTVFYDWFVDNAKPYVNVSGRYIFNDSLSLPSSAVGNGIFPCEFYFYDLGYDVHYITFTIEGSEWFMSFDNERVYADLPSQFIVGWDSDFSSLIIDFGEGTLIPLQLYDYLSSNGTFYGEDIVVLNGTYDFPDVLPTNGAFMSNITFDYGGVTYVSFNFERGTLYFGVGGREFATVYDVSNGGWRYKQSITFDNVVVTPDFANNFDYLINYVAPEPEPTISGYTYDFSLESISFDLVVQSEEESDAGILAWIKNIFNNIKNLPATIALHIRGFFDTLGGKIVNLGTSLLDGIKGLFVPTEDDIVSIKGKFEQLLEDRFGAVYDSAQIIDDYANAFNSQSQSAMIESGGNSLVTFPSITVNLAGTEFAFGGWEVDLVPDKFEPIIEILKLITNIVCTFSFVNAMKRKLEGLLT